jgi:hypothetical protein
MEIVFSFFMIVVCIANAMVAHSRKMKFVEQAKLVLTLLHSHLCSLILWIGKMFWKTHLGDLSTLDYEFWCCSE